MLRNYITTAVRNIKRQKLYSFINISGLAIGMAVCILIYIYIQNELTYDLFHKNSDSIYRVVSSLRQEDGTRNIVGVTAMPAGPALAEEYPEIVRSVRFWSATDVVTRNETVFREDLSFTDPEFFSMFSFEMKHGNAASSLTEKNSVVLEERTAVKYFGNENPVGGILTIKLRSLTRDFTVTGVVKKLPPNSSVKFDFLMNYNVIKDFMGEKYFGAWTAMRTVTFIQLEKTITGADLETKLPPFFEKYLKPAFGNTEVVQLGLQPMKDIHLNPQIRGQLGPFTDPANLFILSGIGLLVLIIACINFMNISIGRSSTRLKEIGARKVFGAIRFQLIKQFLGESMILCVLSLLLGFALAEMFMPVFSSLSNTELSFGSAFNWTALPAVIALIFVVSFVSGGYPALYLSGFRPVEIMKGRFRIGGGSYFTKSLVTLQFSLSVFLIVCALVMSNQTSYMKDKNLGFNSEQVVVIPTNSDDGDKLTMRLKEKLDGYSPVLNITGAGESIGRQNSYSMITVESEVSRPFSYVFKVDEDFIPTVGIELLSGRNFSSEFPADAAQSVIVNEAFVEKFKIGNPVGAEIRAHIGGFEDNRAVIAGVVKDFHFKSMHTAIDPALLHMSEEWPVKYILARISPEDISGTLSMLQTSLNDIAPGLPFDYYFLDDDFNMQYRAEEKWGAIIRYSTFFAVFIAGLGLFGLTALALSRRTKEIGIRKVLGASSSKIAGLVNSEFLALILLSNFIAWPAAYYTMNLWLQNFAYRISIGWEVFIFSAVSALVIGLITVSYHSFKAANSNPVDAIRYE